MTDPTTPRNAMTDALVVAELPVLVAALDDEVMRSIRPMSVRRKEPDRLGGNDGRELLRDFGLDPANEAHREALAVTVEAEQATRHDRWEEEDQARAVTQAEVTAARQREAAIEKRRVILARAPGIRALVEQHGVDLANPAAAVERDWIVPNLLAAGERLIISGPAGIGKSTLLRQFAVAVAAGIDPFTSEPIPPQPTLLLDAQEGEQQLTSELVRPLRIAGDRYSEDDPCRAVFPSEIVPDAVDDGDVLADVVLENLLEICREHRQRLICIGPAYRVAEMLGIKGEIGDADTARELQRWLDQLRERSGAVLIVEGHGGHGQKRVIGTVWWVAWPDFGYNLQKSGVLSRWREDRDRVHPRAFPNRLHQGGDETWAWVTAKTEAAQITDERWALLEAEVRESGVTTVRGLAERTGLTKSVVGRLRDEHPQEWSILLDEVGVDDAKE